MAERRMFAKSIVLSDAFLDMPLSARCLYFTLGMLADDDGFVGSPKAIMRQCGASLDDMNVLLSKRYVLQFDSGVIVIKHWRMNNYLKNDRHKTTTYLEEMKTLVIDDKGAYTERSLLPENTECLHVVSKLDTDCIQNGYTGKYRLGKESIDKDSKDISSEPTASSPVAKLILKDGSVYEVTQDEVNNLKNLYRGANVEKELRHMEGWCSKNPEKRKTRKGIGRFITNWLSHADESKETGSAWEDIK